MLNYLLIPEYIEKKVFEISMISYDFKLKISSLKHFRRMLFNHYYNEYVTTNRGINYLLHQSIIINLH